MNKIIKKQVLATFALVTIMAGVLIGTNCIYAAQDGKETTTIRLINQTYFNVKNIKVTWNDGKEQTVNTLGSHDSIDFSSDARSVSDRAMDGDKTAKRAWDAMIYQIIKYIGAMSTVLHGKVDGILLGGGMVYNKEKVPENGLPS